MVFRVMHTALALGDSTRRSPLPHAGEMERVFERYLDPVYRYLYSRVGNREDAEDMTSEVFLKAARQLESNRSEASVARWLFTVARTVLADHWRRYYRVGPTVPFNDGVGANVEAGDVELPDRNRQLVAEVLEALPPRSRAVLELRFLRGYSVEETAQELSLTSTNVKVIQHRALAKAVEIAGGRL